VPPDQAGQPGHCCPQAADRITGPRSGLRPGPGVTRPAAENFPEHRHLFSSHRARVSAIAGPAAGPRITGPRLPPGGYPVVRRLATPRLCSGAAASRRHLLAAALPPCGVFADRFPGDLLSGPHPIGVGMAAMGAEIMLRRLGLVGLIYIIVGLVVAWQHHYITVHLLKLVLSALLAVFLWWLVLLGVSLHIH